MQITEEKVKGFSKKETRRYCKGKPGITHSWMDDEEQFECVAIFHEYVRRTCEVCGRKIVVKSAD